MSIYFFIPLTKSIFIYNNTTHILQHTIIHRSSFPHSFILKLHHFCYSKHISISFFISHTKSPFFRKQHNQCHDTNEQLQQQLWLHLTFILFISHFHIFSIHIPPQNTHTYLSCTFKFHVSQSIYIYIYIYI